MQLLLPPLFRGQSLLLISVAITLAMAMAMAMAKAEELEFEHAVFDNSNLADVELVQEDSWYQGQAVSYTGSAIWLTPDPTMADPKVNSNIGNLGRMVYKDPFVISPTASISTSFTFAIVTNASLSGSGMAFFLSTSKKAPADSQSGALGLVTYQNTSDLNQTLLPPPFPFFAIEFDTSRSELYRDPSKSHVGIDIDSIVSANVTDTNDTSSPLFLYRNYTFTAWVEFDPRSNLIQVWMINVSLGGNDSSSWVSRPASPVVTFAHDIASIFNGSKVYAGFSSTNRFGYGNLEGTAIYAWNFSMTDPSSNSSSKLPLLVGLPSALVVLLIVFGIAGFFFILARRRRRRRRSRKQDWGVVESRFGRPSRRLTSARLETLSGSQGLLQRYRYKELKRAAGGFSDANRIGEGGYSIVYLAKMPRNRSTTSSSSDSVKGAGLFALKRLKDGVKKEQEFVSEIEIISKLRHRHLLPLEGWCYEHGEAMLLYEYMAKGSLDKYIFASDSSGSAKKESSPSTTTTAATKIPLDGDTRLKIPLDGDTRLKILSGIAAGLEYLHTGLGDCILHRDVKAENVLLRDDFEPVLCDFGLARLISHNQEVTLTAVGTPGYVAPELVYTGRGTDKADVYSFGVLALVVACGRRPVDSTKPPEQMRLIEWVWSLHRLGRLDRALDPSVSHSPEWDCVLRLALLCCHPDPDARPTMRHVLQTLHDFTPVELPSSVPTYPTSAPAPASAPASSVDSSTLHSVISISDSDVSSQPFFSNNYVSTLR